MEVAPISLIIALSPCPNIIYERPILIAVYCIDFSVTVSNFHLFPASHLVSTTYEDEATTDIL